MKIKTSIKFGGVQINRNETLRSTTKRSLKVRTSINAGRRES